MNEHFPTYLFTNVGSHGNEKMSITFTLDEWNSIVHHLQNSQKYLEDRTDTDYKSVIWVAQVAGTIDDKIEKKICKLGLTSIEDQVYYKCEAEPLTSR